MQQQSHLFQDDVSKPEVYNGLNAKFDRDGSIMFPIGAVFSKDEIQQLNDWQETLPEEHVLIGDAGEKNSVYVRRVMIDLPGETPKVTEPEASQKIVDLLGDETRSNFFRTLLGQKQYIRRCQINRMVKDSFIGLHLDTDSNPDYYVSVVIQLGTEFKGGDFVIYDDGKSPKHLVPPYGSVIVSKCKQPHEVLTVEENERVSLVYFYSPNAKENQRVM